MLLLKTIPSDWHSHPCTDVVSSEKIVHSHSLAHLQKAPEWIHNFSHQYAGWAPTVRSKNGANHSLGVGG